MCHFQYHSACASVCETPMCGAFGECVYHRLHIKDSHHDGSHWVKFMPWSLEGLHCRRLDVIWFWSEGHCSLTPRNNLWEQRNLSNVKSFPKNDFYMMRRSNYRSWPQLAIRNSTGLNLKSYSVYSIRMCACSLAASLIVAGPAGLQRVTLSEMIPDWRMFTPSGLWQWDLYENKTVTEQRLWNTTVCPLTMNYDSALCSTGLTVKYSALIYVFNFTLP